jgi:hypothetical protein
MKEWTDSCPAWLSRPIFLKAGNRGSVWLPFVPKCKNKRRGIGEILHAEGISSQLFFKKKWQKRERRTMNRVEIKIKFRLTESAFGFRI